MERRAVGIDAEDLGAVAVDHRDATGKRFAPGVERRAVGVDAEDLIAVAIDHRDAVFGDRDAAAVFQRNDHAEFTDRDVADAGYGHGEAMTGTC